MASYNEPLTTGEPSIGFIGAGTLGRGLALALDAAGSTVAAVSSRTPARAQWLAARISGCTAASTAQDVADACDLVFITTPDAAISQVAAGIKWRSGQGAVHCCGAASVELLDAAADAGAAVGALHPFQTFAGLNDPVEAARRLSGVTFAVSATDWLSDYLPALAERLNGRAIVIPDALRPLYHASAVLACGHLTVLLDAAIGLWTELGLDADAARQAAIPLAQATLDAIAAAGTTAAVTGPAVRGDAATVAAHLEALSRRSPQLLPLYRELTLASLPLARAKGVPEPALSELSRAVAGRHPN